MSATRIDREAATRREALGLAADIGGTRTHEEQVRRIEQFIDRLRRETAEACAVAYLSTGIHDCDECRAWVADTIALVKRGEFAGEVTAAILRAGGAL